MTTPKQTAEKVVTTSFTLLPPKEGVCQQCAVDHQPEEAHNQQSLFWQYYFYGKNGRWPTWSDAISHCDKDVQKMWIEALSEHGIKVETL